MPPAFLSCSTLPPIAIRNRQGVKRRVSKRKGCKSKEIESKRNGFADPSARHHRFGERGAESSSLFAVSQFVVRASRLHCAAGTAALRVYETRHYLPLRPFPGRGDGVRGENLAHTQGSAPTKKTHTRSGIGYLLIGSARSLSCPHTFAGCSLSAADRWSRFSSSSPRGNGCPASRNSTKRSRPD